MAHFADSKILKIVARTEDGYSIHEQPFPGYSEFFGHNIGRDLFAPPAAPASVDQCSQR